MRRIAIVSAILGVLIVADGIFQQVTSYNGGETQQLMQTNVSLSDGLTLIISGAIVLVVSIVAFALAGRSVSAQSQGTRAPSTPEKRVPAKS
jgi:hypothetical protein